MRIALLAAVAATFLSLHTASAHSERIGNLELTDLWARATPPRAPAGGGFVTITNHSDQADRLVAVSSPVAKIGEIHEMKVEDGIMTMRPADSGVEIPPNEAVSFKPGGYHIMLIDLRAPLVEGEDVPVTLTFETAGSIETVLHIAPVGAKAPGPHAGTDTP